MRALALPIGAPGDPPPCIRQRAFGIAGDRQGVPARVLAPQRGLRCIAKFWGNLLCKGLFLCIPLIPTPRSLDGPDHGLPARMDVDMLDRDLLLALATMLVERIEERRPGAG